MHRGLILAVYVWVFWILLPGFLFATGFWLDRRIPVQIPHTGLVTAAGVVTAALGALFAAIAMLQLSRRGKGLPVSHLPPSEFVAGGLYRRFRHPIYLGYTAAFAGAAVLLHSFWSVAFSTPLLIAGWIAYARFHEEPALVRRFGAQYETYRAVTPIFAPRRIRRSR